MDNLSQLLNRSGVCTDPCSGATTPATDEDLCFGHSAANIEEPSCEDWENGFQDCEGKPTVNLIGKINWLWNRVTCAIKNLSGRVDALEAAQTIVNWQVTGAQPNGDYDIIVTFSDGSTASYTITDTDTDTNTRLTNPTPGDTNSNGITDQIVWDIVDIDGNVIGTQIQPVQEFITSSVTGLSFNNGVLTLTQAVGGNQSVAIPVEGGFTGRARFTASGTWTVPAGKTVALVTVIGGGGGGSGGRSGVNPQNNATSHVAGGGGGGGGYAQRLVTVTPGQNIAITIGAGGAGAAFGALANSVGGGGGTSSFGAFVSATGGGGASNQRPGAGGGGGTADVSMSLGSGGYAELQGNAFSKGGFGGGGTRANGIGQVNGSPGVNANRPGAGGGGASYGGGAGASGGNGFRGQISIVF